MGVEKMVMLPFKESVNLLGKHGIRLVRSVAVHSKGDAVEAAKRLRFPVVMKLSSGVHKTDVGGVKLALKDMGSVGEAFDYFAGHFPGKPLVMQHMASGTEVIIGAKRDSQFGPVVLFGLGGVMVEAVHDVSMRVAPVSGRDALEMMSEIRASNVLEGFRGKKAIAKSKVADIVVKVSKLMLKNPEVKEIDLNPVMADSRKAQVVDVRVII